jgi:hypothetical protein
MLDAGAVSERFLFSMNVEFSGNFLVKIQQGVPGLALPVKNSFPRIQRFPDKGTHPLVVRERKYNIIHFSFTFRIFHNDDPLGVSSGQII